MSKKEERMLKVAFETLGCRSNYADTTDIQALVSCRGGIVTTFHDDADVYVLNTCTVTNAADLDAQRIIRRLRRKHPQSRIIVTGCLAEIGFDKLPEQELADAVIGTGRKHEVVSAIFSEPWSASEGAYVEDGTAVAKLVNFSATKIGRSNQRSAIDLTEPLAANLAGPGECLGEVKMRARYHLRIQEGCENFCTYCIVPLTRGKLSSKPMAQVLADVRMLHERGYEEIVLTGTHIGGYGKGSEESLLGLLKALDQLKNGPRIRLSSIDPNDLSNDFVDLVAQSHIFCKHLHICFQAFTDKLLKRMNRRYRMEDAARVVFYVKNKMPGCCIGSDVICGFPGERREDVDQAIQAFLDLPISYLHVFPFSERSGTPATRLDGVVEVEERKARAAQWRALSVKRRNEFLHTLVGTSVEIIAERYDKMNLLYGTSDEFASCVVKLEQKSSSILPRVGARVPVKVMSVDEQEEQLLCEL